MPKKWAKKAGLSKIEASYGVDPTPTGAANAIEWYDFTFRRLSTLLPRSYAKPTLGAVADTEALVHAQVTGNVPIAGAGAAGTAPKYGPLLRACALAEAIEVGVDVEYTPVSAGEESITHYWHMDGDLAKLLGARGTVGLDFVHGQKPMFRFDFMGLFPAEPGAAALPSLTMTGWQPPKAGSSVNTPTFTLGGVALKLHSLSVNLNIDRDFRDYTNHTEVAVTGRENGVRGDLVVLAEPLGTWNPFSIAKAETQAALQLIHGVGAGNIVQLDAPKVQILQPQYDTVNGNAVIRCALLFAENAGNDEVKITVK
jgi:hypothetical protein